MQNAALVLKFVQEVEYVIISAIIPLRSVSA